MPSIVHVACINGIEELIEASIRNDDRQAFLNKDEHGVTPLYYAAQYGHARIVEMIVKFNVNTIFDRVGDDEENIKMMLSQLRIDKQSTQRIYPTASLLVLDSEVYDELISKNLIKHVL